MYFKILKKYLSAYIFPIFKKANIIRIGIMQNISINFKINAILKNIIPNVTMLAII